MSRTFKSNSRRANFLHTGIVAFALLAIAMMIALL